jgi:small-conductance mechanosensitive channel
MHDLQVLFERISLLATAGPLAIPIWLALLFLILSFLRGPLLTGIFRISRISDNDLEVTVRKRLDAPLQLLFFIVALLPFTFVIAQPYGAYVTVVTHIFATFLLFHIVIQSIDLSIFSWYLKRSRTNVSSVMRFFTLSVLYAIAVMLLLDWELHVSVLPLLATSTVLTAVLGLALQDTLKNAFAGLNMSLENSFEQGDWVMFRLDATTQLMGQIVEIGWRTTKIKTLNNNYAIIPNATFTTHELINYNKPSSVHGRTVDIPVLLNGDPEKVKMALIKAALSVDGVLADPQPDALPTEIHSDRIMYQLRFWLADFEARETLTGKVLERCWLELKDQGALAK